MERYFCDICGPELQEAFRITISKKIRDKWEPEFDYGGMEEDFEKACMSAKKYLFRNYPLFQRGRV